jgi:hypothetical protein
LIIFSQNQGHNSKPEDIYILSTVFPVYLDELSYAPRIVRHMRIDFELCEITIFIAIRKLALAFGIAQVLSNY